MVTLPDNPNLAHPNKSLACAQSAQSRGRPPETEDQLRKGRATVTNFGSSHLKALLIEIAQMIEDWKEVFSRFEVRHQRTINRGLDEPVRSDKRRISTS